MRVFRSIQYLRALAAMAVLLFHATQRAGYGLTVGAAGVDVFFVISGFVMGSVTAARPVSPGRFMMARLIRIVPLYWAVTVAMVALAWAGAFPNLQAPPRHVMLSLLFVPHAGPGGDAYPLLVPGWTLNDEMMFYLVFAAALWLPQGRRLLAVSAVLAALVAAGVAFAPQHPLLQAYTDPIVLEFVAGLWLAAHPAPRRAGAVLLGLGAAAFVAQAALPGVGEAWRVLAWGVPAVLVVAGSVALEPVGRASASWLGSLLFRLGAASYAIYLLHGLVVSACWRLLHAAPAPVFIAACVVGSAGLGWGCFVAIERPLTAALRAWSAGAGMRAEALGRVR